MTETKLRELWGDKLYDYCYQQSIQIAGYPDFNVMSMIAIGKIKDKVNLDLGVASIAAQ